jgi:hypothetical protein
MIMGDTIKAIETEYRGYKFRSRLEARWAVFWDSLNVKWYYEHEGYETPEGRYLPDFWLPDIPVRGREYNRNHPGSYQEVKPNLGLDNHPQLAFIGEQLGVGGILTQGFIYDGIAWGKWGDAIYEVAPGWDFGMMIYACECGAVKWEFNEGSYYECYRSGCQKSWNEDAVQSAYDTALRYRFW